VCLQLFSGFKRLHFADCETVSVDENLFGKEAAVIANCDARFEVSSWKRCSAECLQKLLPNTSFDRQTSLSLVNYSLTRNDACSPSPADNGL